MEKTGAPLSESSRVRLAAGGKTKRGPKLIPPGAGGEQNSLKNPIKAPIILVRGRSPHALWMGDNDVRRYPPFF